MSASRGLTFPAGSRDGAVLCLVVSIIDDGDAFEGLETFVVTLTTLDTVILGISMTTVTITRTSGKD